MFNTLIGVFLTDKFKLISDRIVWTESVGASGTSSVTLVNAIDGAAQNASLVNYDFFLTKYTVWTQNGIVQVEFKPDDEALNKVKTYAFTQKTEAPFLPTKLVQAGITINLTNQTAIDDDVFIVVDYFKIPQDKTAEFMELANSIMVAPQNIDIQTLGIEKFLTQTNALLKAILIQQGGTVPGDLPSISGKVSSAEQPAYCKRL